MYEIETSKLPLRRLAAELIVLRELLAAVRASSAYRPRPVQRVLDRIPRLTDKEAWERLSAEERAEAQVDEMENAT